ncbi:MAG: hypothetical protein MUF84_05485 [Anaerolineae bacterium]|jgi:hypothetical protein|nr:hypothetical protein [Anaerolineae bacterium]
MHWMDLVARDPVPWLLDPGNPSARLQTLKHIYRKPAEQLFGEQQALLAWEPVARLRRHWDPMHFWGRAESPYYGGPVGNFGTLYLLTQMGVARFPEVEPVCENLLANGRREDGHYAPQGGGAAPWHCYAGMALHILTHFGYGDDPRVVSAWQALAATMREDPDHLGCVMADRACRAGAVKALAALIHCNTESPGGVDTATMGLLCEYLLAHAYDIAGEDADWAKPRFPRFYDTDLIELCHVLAHTAYRTHPTSQRLLRHMLDLQDADGRWHKEKVTPALAEERIFQPSRWLTFEAVHALVLTYGDALYAP